MHNVAEAFANLFADVLPDPEYVARRSHLHNLAVVWNAVEGGVYQQPTFSEQRLDVEGYLHVGGIHILILQDHGIKFQYAGFFGVHGGKSTKKSRPEDRDLMGP